MAIQTPQIGAGRQAAFGVQSQKKELQQKTLTGAGIGAGIGVGAGLLGMGPRILPQKELSQVKILKQLKRGATEFNKKLAHAFDILSETYKDVRDKKEVQEIKKFLAKGRKAAHEALPKAKVKGALILGAAGAAIGAASTYAYTKLSGNKQA